VCLLPSEPVRCVLELFVRLLGLTVLPKLQTSRLLFWGDLWVFELFVGVLAVTVLPQLSELEIAVLGSLGLLSCL
jgi:hypothetical protein